MDIGGDWLVALDVDEDEDDERRDSSREKDATGHRNQTRPGNSGQALVRSSRHEWWLCRVVRCCVALNASLSDLVVRSRRYTRAWRSPCCSWASGDATMGCGRCPGPARDVTEELVTVAKMREQLKTWACRYERQREMDTKLKTWSWTGTARDTQIPEMREGREFDGVSEACLPQTIEVPP